MSRIDSVARLFKPSNETGTIRMGLERIRPLMEALGTPQSRYRVIHVAGTNGKGSTCSMIESGLHAAGIRSGLFTSPHFDTPLERIRIAGKPFDIREFQRSFETVRAAADHLVNSQLVDSEPSYFEILTAMAFVGFAEAGVHTAVIETGMGGRRDATNVVTPAVCVITSVDFDHEVYLGKGLESIAAEKAGIMKQEVPVVFSAQRPEVARVLEDRATALATPVERGVNYAVRDLAMDSRGSTFLLDVNHGLRIRCPLAGEHQVENARTAALALMRLGIPNAAIETGIANASWPGRLEHVSENPEIILDGAHNPAGARALAAYIRRFYAKRRIRLIYGAMRDKAVAEISGILFPLADQVIVTAPRQARALAPETMREISDHFNLTIAPGIEAALAIPTDADITFVTGSLFLVAEARALLVP